MCSEQIKGIVFKETVVLRRIRSADERLTFGTSAFNFFTVANLPYQLSW